MKKNIAVIGAQWGDEGKGKVVDIYAENADCIVRFQGGNNAGHTLVVHGKKHILHLVPAAALHEDKNCIIANGVVFDIDVFLHEIDELKSNGFLKRSKVYVSDAAHVIMPYHKAIDKLREGNKEATHIGTTGRGIGPAYADKIARFGIRCGDLLNPEYLRARLHEILPEKNCLLEHHYKSKAFVLEEILEQYLEYGKKLKPFITNTTALLQEEIKLGKKILFEGAQGVLLDIDHGTYPFVTSSNTISGAIATGAGVAPHHIHEVVAITKAYTTRVGTGPFPTELKNETGDLIQKVGAEFGATTGRRRRCGWLDLVALKYAAEISGFTGLAITKLDVLSCVPEVSVCTAYEYKGKRLTAFPHSIEELEQVKPIYRTFKSWKALDHVRSQDDFPQELKDYLRFIEDSLQTKAVLISTGPDRAQTVKQAHSCTVQ